MDSNKLLLSLPAFLILILLGIPRTVQAQYDCAAQQEVTQADCEALIALYQATTIDGNWDHDVGFRQAVDGDPNNDLPISQWGTRDPVEIENGRVAHVNLWGNNLNGTLPDAICDLEAVRELDLDLNRLTDTLPTCIGRMAGLEKLSVQQIGYDLEGTLPESLGDLVNLRELTLPGHTFTGPIPATLGNLANLEILALGGSHGLAGNQLDGAIPSSLGQLTKLTTLNLHGNRLTGPIPAVLGNLTELTLLSLGNNALSGTIPASLGTLDQLEILDLAGNAFTDFEDGSHDWSGLQILRLNSNTLTNLPELSGGFAPDFFNVSYNNLTFDDLEPFAGLAGQEQNTFLYENQASVDLRITEENDLTVLWMDAGGTGTVYEWLRRDEATNSFVTIPDSTDARYTVTENGRYGSRARNAQFPDLTLFGPAIDVEVCTETWLPQEDLNASLPPSIRVFEHCNGAVWIVRATPAPGEWSFKVASSSSEPTPGQRTFSKKTVSSFAQSWGAFVAVNGGFFFGDTNLSLIASGGALLSPNVGVLTRDGDSYYPTRATFGVNAFDVMDFAWTYHVRNDDGTRTLYRYPAPTPNAPGSSQAPPTSAFPANGNVWLLQEGIGGGPMLVQNGAVRITWEEEVFFGDGGSGGPVGYVNTRDPRTAMGMTASGELLFVVADGRCADGSTPANDQCADGNMARPGLSHQEMAALMVELGAQEAMNLDGGGSSTLIVNDQVVNRPSDGSARSVASAIVLAPPSTASAAVFDTGDACCYAEEGTWLEDAAGTPSGSTPARLNEVGTGADRAVWRFPDIAPGSYEVAAWWTPGPDRATNTPYTVFQDGVGKSATSVRVDQSDPATANRWNVLGTFDLSPGDSVVVTDDATGTAAPSFVVVDAIRLTAITRTETAAPPGIPDAFHLAPNYPNPFNPETIISFTTLQQARVRLSVYDVLGREVARLVDEVRPPGTYQARLDASHLASGVYFCRLTADGLQQTRTMMLLR